MNCWKPLRVETTLPASNEPAIRNTVSNWAISSRASRLEKGSTTIATASRGQAASKRGGTFFLTTSSLCGRKSFSTVRETCYVVKTL